MLNNLPKTKANTKRVGRGYGSKRGGHTSGRGTKGQKSRSGYKSPRKGFEGGQMPLSRRLPKLKGFSRTFATSKIIANVINLAHLERTFKSGDVVSIESLVENKLISAKSKKQSIKILGQGELKIKLTIDGVNMSAQAQKKIEAAGGKVN
jgi:large subunit ribosomal protein L15